ncbi:hypothetical protein CTI12_AA145830 [Artemisia annua]|uniref:rRNA N-glycosidase n=1 Tax=Artemisia annua TaxID=35608 RepID=A0A2U1PIT9_ARTAN|nr:hypothetical protein CTI12_AA145830 [Artemisia annua]
MSDAPPLEPPILEPAVPLLPFVTLANDSKVMTFKFKTVSEYLRSIYTLRKEFNNRFGRDLIIRFESEQLRFENGIENGAVYLHIERKNLYCMRFNVDAHNLDNPWLLGEGTTLRIRESYSGTVKVGFTRLQEAINEIVGRFRPPAFLLRKTDAWRDTVADALYCIFVMVIEAVRFNWLLHDFCFLIRDQVNCRGLTGEEWNLINSWGTISELCLQNLEWGTTVIWAPLTAAMIVNATTNPRFARHCIAVPNIKMPPEGMPARLSVGL